MSGSRASFLLTLGTLAALLGISSECRAERPAAWRGSALVQLTASREAFGSRSARNWGLSDPVDETYAGPWANSPFAATPTHASGRAVAPTFERTPASAPGTAASPADPNARAETILSRLGPIGMLASVLIPAVMASSGASSRIARHDVTPRVGFAKLGRGYGLMLTGRFY